MKFEDFNWKKIKRNSEKSYFGYTTSVDNKEIYVLTYNEYKELSLQDFVNCSDYSFGIYGVNDIVEVSRKIGIDSSQEQIKDCKTHNIKDCVFVYPIEFKDVMKLIGYYFPHPCQNGGVCYKCSQFDGYAAPSPKHNNKIVCYRCFS